MKITNLGLGPIEIGITGYKILRAEVDLTDPYNEVVHLAPGYTVAINEPLEPQP